VFLFKTGEPVSEARSLGDRMRGAAGQAVVPTKQAGTSAYQGASHGVDGARGWAAPRLESAADAVTSSFAPKVSAVLLTTAGRVRPAEPAKTGLSRLMSWRWMLGIAAAVLAAGAAGVAAMEVKRRYLDATAEAADAADDLHGQDSQAGPAGPATGQARDAAGRAVPHQGPVQSDRFSPTNR
jgi:hypothetical protein